MVWGVAAHREGYRPADNVEACTMSKHRICRECKQSFEDMAPGIAANGVPRTLYCGDKCERRFNTRRYKIRSGRVPQRTCAWKAQVERICDQCFNDDPQRGPYSPENEKCQRCHLIQAARVCKRTRRNQRGRQRLVVPADCRECPHGPKDRG